MLGGNPRGAVELSADGVVVRRWSVEGSPSLACAPLGAAMIPPDARKIHLDVIAETAESAGIFGIDRLDIAGSKYVDPLRDKVRDSQGIH